ncbi:hypothetical protein [Candidatus Neptunochlamydia vexilliferae]|nr:hypothetical protein [Candidatus Neptunochlamydia vexilliferae]
MLEDVGVQQLLCRKQWALAYFSFLEQDGVLLDISMQAINKKEIKWRCQMISLNIPRLSRTTGIRFPPGFYAKYDPNFSVSHIVKGFGKDLFKKLTPYQKLFQEEVDKLNEKLFTKYLQETGKIGNFEKFIESLNPYQQLLEKGVDEVHRQLYDKYTKTVKTQKIMGVAILVLSGALIAAGTYIYRSRKSEQEE